MPYFCWNKAIAKCDGFIFIAQEYNHVITGALKNALDFGRALEQQSSRYCILRRTWWSPCCRTPTRYFRVAIADVCTHPGLSIFTDWEERTTFKPADLHVQVVEKMIDEVISWSTALKTVRTK